jgi:hypothetical protein
MIPLLINVEVTGKGLKNPTFPCTQEAGCAWNGFDETEQSASLLPPPATRTHFPLMSGNPEDYCEEQKLGGELEKAVNTVSQM